MMNLTHEFFWGGIYFQLQEVIGKPLKFYLHLPSLQQSNAHKIQGLVESARKSDKLQMKII